MNLHDACIKEIPYIYMNCTIKERGQAAKFGPLNDIFMGILCAIELCTRTGGVLSKDQLNTLCYWLVVI